MTKEELKKIPFQYRGHIAMVGEHQRSYVNEEYGFGMCIVTKTYNEGMEFCRSRRYFFYKGKWYGWMKNFLEAIKDVKYISK